MPSALPAASTTTQPVVTTAWSKTVLARTIGNGARSARCCRILPMAWVTVRKAVSMTYPRAATTFSRTTDQEDKRAGNGAKSARDLAFQALTRPDLAKREANMTTAAVASTRYPSTGDQQEDRTNGAGVTSATSSLSTATPTVPPAVPTSVLEAASMSFGWTTQRTTARIIGGGARSAMALPMRAIHPPAHAFRAERTTMPAAEIINFKSTPENLWDFRISGHGVVSASCCGIVAMDRRGARKVLLPIMTRVVRGIIPFGTLPEAREISLSRITTIITALSGMSCMYPMTVI